MINTDDVRQLLQDSGEHVLSLYLQVDAALDENQAEKPAWSIYAKNALSKLDKSVEGEDERAIWRDIRERAGAYLNDYEPSGKGLVLFVGEDFEQDYELPVLPLKNAAHYGQALVAPLLWLLDEYEPYLIVLADSEEAHFLSTYLGNVGREEAMASDRFTFDFREKTVMPRPSGPPGIGGKQITAGSNRDRYDDMIADYITKFHRDVAQRIRNLMKKLRAERVIIGGTEKAAHSVYDQLHDETARSVVSVMSIPLQYSDKQVLERVLPVALNYERSKELDLVKEVIDLAKAEGGRGTLGAENVKKALEMGQVESLIVPWPSDDDNLLHELSVKTLMSGGRVELVHSSAARELLEDGEIAARLYYAIQQT